MRQLHRRRQRKGLPIILAIFVGLFIGATGSINMPGWQPRPENPVINTAGQPEAYSQSFSVCSGWPRTNCVIDGDTFWLNGRKIRIADIDAPEIHPARCAYEEQLGQAAKQRLLMLLNAGSFQLTSGERDEDIYGRALRVVSRGGVSLGEMLVREGLARSWDGHRRPWCG